MASPIASTSSKMPTFPLTRSQLASFAQQARSGQHLGIGKANKDRPARSPNELMFLQGEEVVVLMRGSGLDGDGEERWLGFCEGVVGLIRASDLDLVSPLSDPRPPRPPLATISPRGSPSEGLSEASQAASRALQRLASKEAGPSRRIRSRTTSGPRPMAGVFRFDHGSPLDGPIASSSRSEDPSNRFDSVVLTPRSSSTLKFATTLEVTPPRTTSLKPIPRRTTGDEKGKGRMRSETERTVVGLGLAVEVVPDLTVDRPTVSRTTPDCLPYLRSPSLNAPSDSRSYFDPRPPPSDPSSRPQHSQMPSDSSIPTVLASPLLDAARTPPASAFHSPAWGGEPMRRRNTEEGRTPRARTTTVEPEDTDDEAGQEILAAYADSSSSGSFDALAASDDLASRLRRRVETSQSPTIVATASPPASSCESTPTSAPTPEWTSGSSSSSDSSEPVTPFAAPPRSTVRPKAPSSLPVISRKAAPANTTKPLPLRTSSVPASANTLQDIVGMRRPRVDPAAQFQDLSRRTGVHPSGSKTSGLGRRTISTPTLTLHTNKALEAAIGMPATPLPPDMSSLPASPAQPSPIAQASPKPALPQIAVPVSSPRRQDSLQKSTASPISPSSTHSLYSYPGRTMSPGSEVESSKTVAPQTPPTKVTVVRSPSGKLIKTKSMGQLRTLRQGLSPPPPSSAMVPSPSLPDPRLPQHRAVGPEDYRREEVVFPGGPSFEIVKPNLRRLQQQEGDRSSGGASSDSLGRPSGSVEADTTTTAEGVDVDDREAFVEGLRPTAKAKERVRSQLFDENFDALSPSHTRAHSSPHSLARPGESIDEYGFFRPSASVRDLVGSHRPDEQRSEDVRAKEAKWLSVLASTPSQSARGNKKLKKLARKGIPNSLRAKVWARMLDVDEFRCQGVWERLAQKGAMEDTYDEIEKDLKRCFPDHKDFRDPDSPMIADLRTLLRAFAQYSSQFEPNLRVGYTQGLGVIGGFLLMHAPGEEAFWILVAIVRRLCPGWWSKSLGGFRRDTLVFEKLLDAADPTLAKHLRQNDIDVNMWLPAPFLQLFIRTLPWPCLLRTMDVFMIEGPKLLFRIGLGMLNVTRDTLLGFDNQMDLLEFLLNVPQHRLHAITLLPTAFAITLKTATIERLRTKCQDHLDRQARR